MTARRFNHKFKGLNYTFKGLMAKKYQKLVFLPLFPSFLQHKIDDFSLLRQQAMDARVLPMPYAEVAFFFKLFKTTVQRVSK
jgi:hypothetical protein